MPAKKKNTDKDKSKQYGTLIRVSGAFAEAMKRASSFEDLSVADFADAYLIAIVEKRWQDGVVRAAKKIEGKS